MQDTEYADPQITARRRGVGRTLLFVAVLAFVLGIALAGWVVSRGGLELIGLGGTTRTSSDTATAVYTPPPISAVAAPAPTPSDPALNGVETRLALLEERLSRLDLQANAASGNAARAEGLLVAFAARRLLDKGAQLGPLENQLKLRFGGAQPQAVRTLGEFSRAPVTLDQLIAGLDAIAPELGSTTGNLGGWDRIRAELASLFVITKSGDPEPEPRARVERARLMLTAGKYDAAIAEVERMPGSANAAAWIERARRYGEAQQALDLVETAALLEPRLLNDGAGKTVSVPGPLAPATTEPDGGTNP